MQKRGQAAFEFMMTYGWAIMVVLIAIAALSFFLGSTETCPPTYEFSNQGFQIVDQKFLGSDLDLEAANNLFYLIVKNVFRESVTISEITIKKGATVCETVEIPNIELSQGESTRQLIGQLSEITCQGASEECYGFDIEIEYTDTNSGLTHTTTGYMGGAFEPTPDQLWSLGGAWTTQGITGNVLTVENRAGETINYCNVESPPESSTLTEEVPSGTIYWDLPSGCSTSGIAQVGFDSATCDARSQLSKGWLYNTLYLDEIFSEYNVFVGGNAGYLDTTDGEYKTNGICLNDNLYFYLNGELKYYGGTTGTMLGAEDTYQDGDEIMRGCDGCSDVDSSAWCIPAFELSANGFNFGESNDIHILVEDFCLWEAEHAGGMSNLNIYLI